MEKILIVDDEKTVRKLLCKILESAGYYCRSAAGTEEAKQILQNDTFDLLVTDLNMPGESGAVLSRYVKECYPATAIVMVTIVDNPDQAREVLDIGVYGFIVKPFTRNLVLITVENALRRNRLELELQAHNTLLELEIAKQVKETAKQLSFLQALMEAIPSPMYYKDMNDIYQGCNKACIDFFGMTSEDIIGSHIAEIVGEQQVKGIKRKDDELIASSTRQVFETKVNNASGTQHDILVHRDKYTDDSGKIAGIVGILIDITERKNTEQRLHASEEKLRTIMDNLHIGVAMVSPNLDILQVNKQILHWFPDAMIAKGKQCFSFCNRGRPSTECAQSCPHIKTFQENAPTEALYRLATAAGERDFRVHFIPVLDIKGEKVVAAIELFEDISEKLAVEQELRQAQKLESIGSLAAGIAHEINTPTQYVGDNLRFLEDSFGDILKLLEQYSSLLAQLKAGAGIETEVKALEETIEDVDLDFLIGEIPDTIEQTLDGVEQVGNIVRAMREFSHPGSDEKVQVDINKALESTITVSRNEWKYHAELVTHFEKNLPLVQCMPSEINQAFLNIIVNAAHAIAERATSETDQGTIKITTQNENKAVLIRFRDTGPGIPVSVQQRIFDPFFTTKTIGKGTGQGLSIARNVIVDKHDGEIWFESEEGTGTTFFIRLPVG